MIDFESSLQKLKTKVENNLPYCLLNVGRRVTFDKVLKLADQKTRQIEEWKNEAQSDSFKIWQHEYLTHCDAYEFFERYRQHTLVTKPEEQVMKKQLDTAFLNASAVMVNVLRSQGAKDERKIFCTIRAMARIN